MKINERIFFSKQKKIIKSSYTRKDDKRHHGSTGFGVDRSLLDLKRCEVCRNMKSQRDFRMDSNICRECDGRE